MQPSLTRTASLTHELATTVQRTLAWLPASLERRASSEQLRDHCRRLRHQLASVRRHHKPAWAAFARVADRDGFMLWNGDRMESAHQAVATIAQRLYLLLGGRRVARCDSGPSAPAHLLRLELFVRRFVETLLPGFDIAKPAMPLGLFQALAWEHRTAHAEPVRVSIQGPAPNTGGITPDSEWEKLGPDRREILQRFHRLQKPVASAKDILGHQPTGAEEWHFQQLVKLGYLRKPGGLSGRDRRGYCHGRLPSGFPDLRLTDVG